jgi:hypothetical protein
MLRKKSKLRMKKLRKKKKEEEVKIFSKRLFDNK